MILADILAPIGIDEFRRDYLGQQYLLVPGTTGRFRELVSWRELNAVLSGLRVDDNRVALVKHGRPISPDSYVYFSLSGRSRYLIGPSVRTHVLDGATLIVNHVDTLLPVVRCLVESCEDAFETHVAANLYVGWRTDKGFDVHWDTHDTLIVQVLGRKTWKVWHPTRVHPLPDDTSGPVPQPTNDPVWQGELENGGALYMPRGWWHVAWPCDQPSLHVTIGIKHPTGVDLITWVTHALKSSIDIRKDIPHWKERGQQLAWLQAVRGALATALHDRIIDEYLDDVVNTTQPRAIVRLPEVTAASLPIRIDENDSLRLVHVRRLRLQERDGDTLIFMTSDKQWRCNALLRPALNLLHAVVPCTLRAMLNAVEERARPLVRPFMSALVSAGVIWVDHGDAGPTNHFTNAPSNSRT